MRNLSFWCELFLADGKCLVGRVMAKCGASSERTRDVLAMNYE